jgi:ATP-dependent helicase HrpA
MLGERVERLVRGLPKDLRRACQPVTETVAGFVAARRGRAPDGPLEVRLAQYLHERLGVRAEPSLLDPARLEGPWLVKLWVCDDAGRELGCGADLGALRRKLAPALRGRAEAAADAAWGRSGMKDWECGELPERVATPTGEAFPALVDEGETVGVRAFAAAWQAAESHRAGCVRLLRLAHPDQAQWVAQHFPLGIAAKVELARLGRAGVTLDELVAVAAEGALGEPLPRTAEAFRRCAQAGRGAWHDAAKRLGKALDETVAGLPLVRTWIENNRRSPHLAPVAADLEEQLEWLLRPRFAWRAGFRRLAGYGRHFQAIRTRLGRLDSLPIARDLEKMTRLRRWWEPWLARWTAAPDDPRWWPFGWLLEEWRVGLFAPETKAEGVSEKKLGKAWEELGG